VLYEYGNEVPQDKGRAAGYFKQACERGDTEACQRGVALGK